MRRRFELIALALATLTACAPIAGGAEGPPAAFSGRAEFTAPDDRFGGFSGLEMLPETEGLQALALSDRGTIWQLHLARDDTGAIESIMSLPVAELRAGATAKSDRYGVDSEGLSLTASGLVISFESTQRVADYPIPDLVSGRSQITKPSNVTLHPGWPGLEVNKSLEAVATDAVGKIYTLPEDGQIEGRIPIYTPDGEQWALAGWVPPSGAFLPVGADIGPDGRFYLLERDFALVGFRSQVRSFLLNETGVQDIRTHLTTSLREHDNLEGLSVWRDGQGVLRLTMISDDNQNSLQVTEVVEYILPE